MSAAGIRICIGTRCQRVWLRASMFDCVPQKCSLALRESDQAGRSPGSWRSLWCGAEAMPAPGLRSTGRTLARWRPSSRVLLWLLEKCRWQLFFRRPATLPVNPVDPADRQQHLTAAQPHAQQRRYSFCDQLPANPSGWGSQNGISSGNHDCSQHTSAVSIGQG